VTGSASETWAVIAGGGTAGHVLPGLAIAHALVARGHPPATVHYVGSERGLEAQLVPAAGFPLTLLPGRGLQRKFTVDNVGALVGLARAFGQAISLLRRERPKVVIALGGYASVPCALAAVILRVPIVVAEQNARPGAANRVVSRFARACAVSFPGTPLPRAVVTGNPIRQAMLGIDRDRDGPAARETLGAGARHMLLVFGGSLGALRVNEAAIAASQGWLDRRDLAVRHVIGNRDWDQLQGELPHPPVGGLVYEPVRYEERMDVAMAAADVAVTRAGSSTLFELAAAGVPALLVPSPYVTADHQTANARHLEQAGAAVVVPDAELDGTRLSAEVDALLADPDRRAAMSHAIRAFSRPQAADDVAALAEQYARG
jgi:undecaprenyldiphospho-muramoylpentapeptide beta-N-acetylglucosaminyltransferase